MWPCGRKICDQDPLNAWQIQYRQVDDEQICLRCCQNKLLEWGHAFEQEKIGSGEIPGMFFSYGNLEAKGARYDEVPGLRNHFINDWQKVDQVRKKVLESYSSVRGLGDYR